MISAAQAIARYRDFVGDTDPTWVDFAELAGERNVFGLPLLCILLGELAGGGGGGGGGPSIADITTAIQAATAFTGGSLGDLELQAADVLSALNIIKADTSAITASAASIAASAASLVTQGTANASDTLVSQNIARGTVGLEVTAAATLNAVGAGAAIDLSAFQVPVNGDFYFSTTGAGSIQVQFEQAEADGGPWRAIQPSTTITTVTDGQAFFQGRNYRFVRINVLSQSGTVAFSYQFRARRGC